MSKVCQISNKHTDKCPDPPYLTPAEVATRWRKDPSTIRRWFRDCPGVLKFGKKQRRDGKREYIELLIPEALVLERERDLAA
jgi:hypothetical protein